MRPARPSRTWAGVVALTRPEGLAEGAASGPAKAASRRRASGCAGTRSATVARPAVASSERPVAGRRGSTRVSGPGQKRAASARAAGVKAARASAAAASVTCTISGLKAGRPLAAKIAGDRPVIAGVGAEAVDGLGREGDQLAGAEQGDGGAEAAVAVGERDGVAVGHGVTLRPACGGGRPGLTPAPRRPLISRAARRPQSPRSQRPGETVMTYRAPVTEMRFLLDKVLGAGRLAETERYAEATPETVEAILGEAAKLAEDVLAPLRRAGDLEGRAAGERGGAGDARVRSGLPDAVRGRLGRDRGGARIRRYGAAGGPADLPETRCARGRTWRCRCARS